jgi:hypothetical protein
MSEGPAQPYTLSDTWHLNNRVNLLLLDHLTAGQLAFAANPKGRSIADQFAHLHNVRIVWLEPRVPAVAKALKKIEKGAARFHSGMVSIPRKWYTKTPNISDSPAIGIRYSVVGVICP